MSQQRRREKVDLEDYQAKIAESNRYNILSHCRVCDYEWVTSTAGESCPDCQSQNVQYISCWQFPDD